MGSFFFSFIDLIIFALYFYLFGVQVSCPICGRDQRALTYKQFGVILIVLNVFSFLLDSFNDEALFSYIDIILWILPVYFLFRSPSFFCRHCLKEMPLKDCQLLNKPLFY